jgi:Glycosyl transferase family 2
MSTVQGAVEQGAAVGPLKTEPEPARARRACPAPNRGSVGSGHLDFASRAAVVTTLTPVLNEERHVRETVAALQAQNIAETEFIFIHGPSTDRTGAILSELAAEDELIRVLDNPRGQTATALNIGLRAARVSTLRGLTRMRGIPPITYRAPLNACGGAMSIGWLGRRFRWGRIPGRVVSRRRSGRGWRPERRDAGSGMWPTIAVARSSSGRACSPASGGE